jgi:tetratricopeptide (TPR) repeat protein
MATVITLPTRATVKPPAHVKRRVKYSRRPVANLYFLDEARQSRTIAPTAKQAAYSLYLEGSKLDETDVRGAIPLYERALELDPGLHIAMTNLGNCHFRLGRAEAAKACYMKAVDLSPNQPEGLYNLGYILLEDGDCDAAIPLFQKAIENDPSFSDAYYNLGMALKAKGMPAAALPVQRAFRKYIALESDTGSQWLESAKAALRA